MAYQVTLRKSAVKALAKIDEPYYSKLKSAIYALGDDPRPTGCKKLKGRDSYRIRIGDYRVIYDIFDKVLLIDVIDLGHRKEIYD
jgi:mRNA interferase RelE/StbE